MIQGSRRLYECVYISKPGTSKMWIGHYLLGIGYYVVMSVAVWVEGTGLHPPPPLLRVVVLSVKLTVMDHCSCD